jgi:hypothetical protein
MKMTVEDQTENGCLNITITGDWITAELKDFIDTVAVEMKRRNCNRLFADMSTIVGPPPDMDRFSTGKYIATTLNNIKIAIVYRKVLTNTFLEDTAVNRGAFLRVFPDKISAAKWLWE